MLFIETHLHGITPAAPYGEVKCFDEIVVRPLRQIITGIEDPAPHGKELGIGALLVLVFCNHGLQLHHVRMKPGQLLHAAQQLNQQMQAFSPAQIIGLHDFFIYGLNQRFDAVTDISRMQGLFAGKVVIQRSNGYARFQSNRASSQFLPAVALPNPNIAVEYGLYSHTCSGLSGPFAWFVALLGAVVFVHCKSEPLQSEPGLQFSYAIFLVPEAVMTQIQSLQTDKRDLARTRIATQTVGELQAGQALLKISRLALTTNNITYAAFGDTPHLRYWDFFPTGDADWGHMPAWGFADVVDTTVEGLAIGERFYGYWPIATHLVMEPIRVTERGFYDGSEHRLELVSAYNQYQRNSSDAAYRPENEDYQMLLRPLFITSFMLADYLEDNGFFGAKRIVVASASSKTAFGTMFCLQGRDDIELVGLTSAGNKSYVESLGCYHQAITYDELESLDASVPTLYVDFSGSADLRQRVHAHLGSSLMHDCYAGSAHSQDHISEQNLELAGPKPQAYFAPNQIRKRNADWGPGEVTRRFNIAQLAFIERVRDPNSPWITLQNHQGLASAQPLIDTLVNGRIHPRDGHVLILD